MRRLVMPQGVWALIALLEQAGFEGYAVGGCVRDSLLSRAPHDWDITTSATPAQMKACFSGYRTIDTGEKHGTITVLVDNAPIEVTCFRADGEYKDHRRPDSVTFVSRLSDDLARRDFTINAMALRQDGGLIDLFCGQEDLSAKLVRCVGEPTQRFEEDALRILRALRFASVYEFAIEAATARAMRQKKALLAHVSAERVYEELRRMLCGQGVQTVLLAFPDVLAEWIPEILPALGFDQSNPHHDADVWTHTARAVASVEQEPALRLTMLLHDLGKPRCFTLDDRGIGHFYGHAKVSESIADAVLTRLRADNQTRERVLLLIRIHDTRLEDDDRWIKRRLNQLGERSFRDLLLVQRADTLAQSDHARAKKLALLDAVEQRLVRILAHNGCFQLSQLAVNGRDLLQLGMPAGERVGAMLAHLLRMVIDGHLPNEREALLAQARRDMRADEN